LFEKPFEKRVEAYYKIEVSKTFISKMNRIGIGI
jgi:hypothetical protein